MTLASPALERRDGRRSLRALGAGGLALACLAHLSPPARADQRPGIFRITPLRPVAELRQEALAASPPPEAGPFRPVDLVELTSLDPTIRLDIRYATADNFLSTPVYDEARAFLQRPAAEALAAGPPGPRGHRPRAPRPRRLPAVVGDEGLLGGHPGRQA